MVEYVVYFVYFVYSVYFVYFGMVEYSTVCTFCIAVYIELGQNIVHFVLYDDLFKLSFTSPHHLTNILFFQVCSPSFIISHHHSSLNVKKSLVGHNISSEQTTLLRNKLNSINCKNTAKQCERLSQSYWFIDRGF